MASDRPANRDSVREAIRRCPDVGSDSWVVSLSIATRGGKKIEGQSI
jgi:hypothetical protein